MSQPPELKLEAGTIAVTTHGTIEAETAECLINLRGHLERAGVGHLVHWRWIHQALVDKARNEAVYKFLENKDLRWLWMIDADMVFQPQIADSIFRTAFLDCPWADVVGGYCQLKGFPNLPTMDLGSGQWESVDAHCGPQEVIRTGGACILFKRHVFERIQPPWFGVRTVDTPLRYMAEFDNYARQKFDGRNPFRDLPAWDQLQGCAAQDHVRVRNNHQAVGEDSNFCDSVKAAGMRIVVDTNAVCGHRDRKTIWPADHQEALAKARQAQEQLCGVLG